MAMFTIYRKDVGGRVHDRYFQDYAAARRELHADVDRMRDTCHARVTGRIDRMNMAKGFYMYEIRMAMPDGEKVSHAILDGYFEDEPNE